MKMEVEQMKKDMMTKQIKAMELEVQIKKLNNEYKVIAQEIMDIREKISDILFGKVTKL